ncbi:hypothetical protein TNCV_3915661 [Trichonephila clavipes]|nr:hypothetical protein TNCV_3915661 [Trichonephila clavipes]
MIVEFRNEKVSNHGSIPITIDFNVVAFIVFEEGFHQPIKRTKHQPTSSSQNRRQMPRYTAHTGNNSCSVSKKAVLKDVLTTLAKTIPNELKEKFAEEILEEFTDNCQYEKVIQQIVRLIKRGRSRLVIKVTESWPTCHELQPGTVEEPLIEGIDAQKRSPVGEAWKEEGGQFMCRPRHLTMVRNSEVRLQKLSSS